MVFSYHFQGVAEFCFQPDAQASKKMLNLGNNLDENPLSCPSKFGIRHNLCSADNVHHGITYIC